MKKLLLVLAAAVFVAPAAFAQWSTNGTNVFYNGGNVGIGTNTPSSILHLAGAGGVSTLTFNSPGTHKFRFGTIPGIINWGALTLNASYNGSGWVLDDTTLNGWFFKLDNRGANTGNENNGLWLFRIPNGAGNHTDEGPVFGVTNGRAWFGGKIGVGTATSFDPTAQLYVQGTGRFTSDLTVDGNIAAKYQDVAEWVPSSQTLKPGMVVVVDPGARNEVIASTKSYETSVAGVVSAKPGLILGEAGHSKAQIATTGRVKVWVDATNGPIHPGDLLVTSSEPGVAMKSEPVDLGGIKIHRPGTIVGKALEPIESGKGEILVLLSMQ